MISKSDIDLQSKEIGSRIRKRRTLLGLRLEDLSMISGVTCGNNVTYGAWEQEH